MDEFHSFPFSSAFFLCSFLFTPFVELLLSIYLSIYLSVSSIESGRVGVLLIIKVLCRGCWSDGVVEKRGRVWFRVERAFEPSIYRVDGMLTIFFFI